MAEEQKTYPVIPITRWRELRNKFKQKIPSSVTPSYLASALSMEEKSAKSNVLPALVRCGIIDQDGTPLKRATSWRDDQEYPQVCKEIREEIYPTELLEALPGPSTDRSGVERWFAKKLGVGEKAVKRMAAVYELLWEADASKGADASTADAAGGGKAKLPKTRKASQAAPKPEEDRKVTSYRSGPPSIHIDVQIHISPDASVDQIDQVFASMGKHLGPLFEHGNVSDE